MYPSLNLLSCLSASLQILTLPGFVHLKLNLLIPEYTGFRAMNNSEIKYIINTIKIAGSVVILIVRPHWRADRCSKGD